MLCVVRGGDFVVLGEGSLELLLEITGMVGVLCPLIDCAVELCRDGFEFRFVLLHAEFEIAQAVMADVRIVVGFALWALKSSVELLRRASSCYLLSRRLGRLDFASFGKRDPAAGAGVVDAPF